MYYMGRVFTNTYNYITQTELHVVKGVWMITSFFPHGPPWKVSFEIFLVKGQRQMFLLQQVVWSVLYSVVIVTVVYEKRSWSYIDCLIQKEILCDLSEPLVHWVNKFLQFWWTVINNQLTVIITVSYSKFCVVVELMYTVKRVYNEVLGTSKFTSL